MPPARRTPATKKRPPTRTPAARPGAVSRRTLWLALAGAAVVAAALIGGSLLLRGGDDDSSGAVPTVGDPALVDGIPQQGTTLGSPDAKVTLIQWEDFQCPACEAYQQGAFPGIVEEYVRPGKVKIEFKGLQFLGEDSDQALRAALAAARQGKFWQMEKLLYDAQGEENSGWVTDELIRELATTLELDVAKLEADMASAAVTEQIEAADREGEALQVAGTPTFFVSIDGGEPYQVQPEAFTVEAFRPILDDALQG